MKLMKFPSIRFNWQTPKLFKYAGLYLTVNGKRYRIIKIGQY